MNAHILYSEAVLKKMLQLNASLTTKQQNCNYTNIQKLPLGWIFFLKQIVLFIKDALKSHCSQ